MCYVNLFECKGPQMLKIDSLIFREILNYFAASQYNKFCGAVWRKYDK